MDLLEMDKMITALECANEKAKITVSDLNNIYFGDANPQKSFLEFYYDTARIKISITLDYINELELIIKTLRETINEAELVDSAH